MKKNLRYFMTLLLMMVASVGWAESKTEGFEAKAASTTYNSTVTVSESESDCGIGWSIYYGTVSTNDKISDTKSAQMRWYSSANENYPYLMSTTSIDGLQKVDLKARTSSLDVKMDVSYSADGETWTVGTTYTFTATGKGEAVSLDIPSGKKYVKFGVSSSSTAPTSGNYKLIVDDVVLTYENSSSSLLDPGLAFASSEQTITLGDSFTLPELTNNGDGTVTFTSSNTAVATINSTTGEVEVLSAGKAVFTASSAETETYRAGRATFTLTVNPVPSPIEDGVFDFTGVQAYGTGLTPTSDNSYIEETKTWTAGNVTLVTSGKYRWWYAESGNTLRVFAPSEGNTTLTLSVPEGNVISQIVITGNSDCKTLVSNIGTYDTDNYTWTGQAQTVVISRGSANAQIKTITVTYGVGTEKQDPGLAFSSTTATANIGETFTAPTLSYAEGFDGTITYFSSNTDVATVNATGDVTILAVGETTITATFAGDDTYEEGSASYTLTVIDPNATGASADNPYTVAQVLDLFENDEVPTSEVYVKGTISNIKSLDVSKYKRAQYYISDDGTTENQFYVYNGYYLNGADFTANDQIKVGDKVVIYGKLTTYSGTNEFAADNYIVSLEHVGKAPAELSYATASVTKYVGDADFTNALTNNHDLSISYSSSDPTVATVDENGLVSILSAGTTIITATSEETEEYEAGEASYTLEVKESTSLVTVDADGNVTFDLTDNAWGFPTDGTNQAEASFSNSGYTIKVAATTNYKYYNDGYFLLGKENSYLTLPAFDFDVEKIEVVGRSGASGSVVQNIFVGENAASTETTGAKGTNIYEIGADYQTAGTIYTLKVTSAHNTQITSIKVYKKQAAPANITLSPAKEYTTLTSAYALDFSAVDGLAAYIVKEEDVTATSVKLTQVSKVPANTGLVIQKTGTEDSYSVPVLTGDPDDVSENKMVGSATTTTPIAENAGYILKDGKFSPSAEGTLAAGKAYLAVSVLAGAKDLNIVFGEGTGINNVNVNENESGKIFNLAGQQMKSAVKGVYIKNGKKYIK